MITAGELRLFSAIGTLGAVGLSLGSLALTRRWRRRAIEAELLLDAATQATCPKCGASMVPSQRTRIREADDPHEMFGDA